MLIFIALMYFCLACTVIWLIFFPSGRDMVLQFIANMGRSVELRVANWQRGSAPQPAVFRRTWRGLLKGVFKFVRRHSWLCVGALVLCVVPTMLALFMSNPSMLPGYEPSNAAPDEQIAALLKGEQLAPPVALPPVAFSTLEVTLVRPMLVNASRNWTMLNADFSQRLLMAFKIMKEKHGYEMALLEGYRSPERQNLLASMGTQVTNAKAFQSWHQYGLAADCAFWRDGKLVISEKDPWAMRGYQLYGEVAESLGLTWGGRWKMMDFGHTELRMRGVMRR